MQKEGKVKVKNQSINLFQHTYWYVKFKEETYHALLCKLGSFLIYYSLSRALKHSVVN